MGAAVSGGVHYIGRGGGVFAAAAGCMVCVTAQEMIPQAVEEDEPAGVVSIVLGFALMMALDVAL